MGESITKLKIRKSIKEIKRFALKYDKMLIVLTLTASFIAGGICIKSSIGPTPVVPFT